ncbi:exonuclease domain-containing protein [Acidaminococcus intestini]|uniref:exonuclease domain-containing protein n=1 Tax=Acidaminococcus intestini TaxID=187327 RepID=UPI002E7902D1|nr:exonuclease domain-containing protein [Acidaminococcus intestini]
MSGLIFLILIFLFWHYRNKKNPTSKSKATMPEGGLKKLILPSSNGFARMTLPITNRYAVPVDGFVAFDVETANEQPYSICSISAVKVQGSSIVDVITSLIKPPETRFTNTRIHGITWEKVRSAPTFKEYYESTLHDFIKGYVLVAHNAQFDMGCLLHVAEAEGISLDKPLLFADSLQSARYVYRDLPNHKLDTICRHLSIDLDHHDSLSDARACARIMRDTIQKGANPIIKSLFCPSQELFVKSALRKARLTCGGMSFGDLYTEAPEGYTEDDFIRDFVNPGKYAKLKDVTKEHQLNKLHKPELKKILEEAEIPSKGLKKDLIALIIEKGIAPPLPEGCQHIYRLDEESK